MPSSSTPNLSLDYRSDPQYPQHELLYLFTAILHHDTFIPDLLDLLHSLRPILKFQNPFVSFLNTLPSCIEPRSLLLKHIETAFHTDSFSEFCPSMFKDTVPPKYWPRPNYTVIVLPTFLIQCDDFYRITATSFQTENSTSKVYHLSYLPLFNIVNVLLKHKRLVPSLSSSRLETPHDLHIWFTDFLTAFDILSPPQIPRILHTPIIPYPNRPMFQSILQTSLHQLPNQVPLVIANAIPTIIDSTLCLPKSSKRFINQTLRLLCYHEYSSPTEQSFTDVLFHSSIDTLTFITSDHSISEQTSTLHRLIRTLPAEIKQQILLLVLSHKINFPAQIIDPIPATYPNTSFLRYYSIQPEYCCRLTPLPYLELLVHLRFYKSNPISRHSFRHLPEDPTFPNVIPILLGPSTDDIPTLPPGYPTYRRPPFNLKPCPDHFEMSNHLALS